MKRVLFLAALAAASCKAAPPISYLNRDVTTVAVLPPFNNSNDLAARDYVWPLVEREFACRGYALVPRERIQEFYAKNKFTIAEEIKLYKTEELAKEWGCQAIVYTLIEEYGQKYLVVETESRVRISADFAYGATGSSLWKDAGEASRNSSTRHDSDVASILLEALFNTITKADVHGLAEDAVRSAFWRLPYAGYDPPPKK